MTMAQNMLQMITAKRVANIRAICKNYNEW